jgi:hypothetical protein
MSEYFVVYEYENDDDDQIIAIEGVGKTSNEAWKAAEDRHWVSCEWQWCCTDCTEALYTKVMEHGHDSFQPCWNQEGYMDVENA